MNKSDIVLRVDNKFAIYPSGEKTYSNIITIVSGLPRSGTSMVMKMLDLGNMPLLSDNIRQPDLDNPQGYYEYERVKELEHDNSWLEMARGKAVKIVSPLLQYLILDKAYRYKIIFMLRNLDEVLASQKKMADRLNQHEDRISDNILKQHYTSHIEEVRYWLEQNENIDFMFLNYKDVICNPASVSEDISVFLGINLNVQAMSMVADNALYRQQKDTIINNADIVLQKENTDKEAIMDQLRQLGYL
jgi:hypothetical protein